MDDARVYEGRAPNHASVAPSVVADDSDSLDDGLEAAFDDDERDDEYDAHEEGEALAVTDEDGSAGGAPPQDMARLVETHAGLVKRIAYHLLGRLPPTAEVEDLIQAGMIGLLEAARNYSSDGGANFTTFAGIRIRGAMLDEVRKVDWAPRPLWRQLRHLSRVMSELEHQQGRDVSDREVAERMELSLDDYHRLLRDAACARVVSFDSMVEDDPSMANALLEDHSGPLKHLQDSTFIKVLSEEIERLPERQRLVMALYYDDELNLREIGEVLGVTESRVSQIHKQAKVNLRVRLTEWVNENS